MYTILGAGLSGISAADHLGKKNIPYSIFEAKAHGGGHIHSEVVDGFTWDEGPHVSFTKYQYVKDYFANNCDQQFLEYPTKPTNYYKGSWIMHPAQSNMYAIPQPLRAECVEDVVAIREDLPAGCQPANYQEWIDYAFGKTFAENFPKVYTQKYWTTEPENLTTDWIGKRVYFPEITDMVESAKGPLTKETHYISSVRYPQQGGYYSYIKNIEAALNINYNKKLKHISFDKKQLLFEDGEQVSYEKLVSTLPLPMLIQNSDAPEHIKSSADKLKCSQVLIINVIANHPPVIDNHWIYVYDNDMYATRINFTDLLAPNNGVEGQCGIQVEVYFSDYHPFTGDAAEIAKEVVYKELIQMGLVRFKADIQSYHHKWIEWANVIFDNQRIAAQDKVLAWLETKGLVREQDDLEPMTDWDTKAGQRLGDIVMAGRFAQWKYYWTDDCVLRGRYISDSLSFNIN
jgi:protoporphyrinogen oxidase